MITASHLVTCWTRVMNNVYSRWSHDWANALYLLWYAVGGVGSSLTLVSEEGILKVG